MKSIDNLQITLYETDVYSYMSPDFVTEFQGVNRKAAPFREFLYTAQGTFPTYYDFGRAERRRQKGAVWRF